MTDHVDDPGHQHTAPDHASRAAGPIPVLRLDTARRGDGRSNRYGGPATSICTRRIRTRQQGCRTGHAGRARNSGL